MVTVEGTPVPAFGFFFLHAHLKVRGSQFVSNEHEELGKRDQGMAGGNTVDHFVFPSFLLTSNCM